MISGSRTKRLARSLWADSSQREQLLDDYIRMISFDGQRTIAPGYIEHLRKQFMGMPLPDLLQRIEDDKKYIDVEKKNWETSNAVKAEEDKRQQLNLRTKEGEYERTDGTFERAICSDENPLFEKKGMPAFGDEMGVADRELRGYYGVHVGGGWLSIMVRDQYCDHKNAYLYEIDTGPAYRSKKPFYVMEDFHVADRTNVPSSEILFSKNPVIPARLITLKKVIPVSRIRPAPDLY